MIRSEKIRLSQRWKHLLTRWWIVALVGLLVLFLDIFQDLFQAGRSPVSILRFGDFFALILISLSFLLGLYWQKKANEKSTLKRLSLQNKFSTELARAKDWDEIISVVSSFLATFLNLSISTLYIHKREINSLSKVSEWVSDRAMAAEYLLSESVNYCEVCQDVQRVNGQIPICIAPKSNYPDRSVIINSYCLVLQLDEHPIGVLRISLEHNRSLRPQQTEQVKTLLPILTIVVQAAIERQTALDLTVTTAREDERRDLTHDLHDMLGQNLSFLRLKLEQISRVRQPEQHEKMQKDLDHMLMVASESSELVKDTLIILDPDEPLPLRKAVKAYCAIVGDRSNLTIDFEVHGRPARFSQHAYRQILFLFREILSNIEKHATATTVKVSLMWNDENLEIRVSDDGVGFDPEVSQPDGHFGLKSMRQRVMDLNGTMSINSKPGSGTQVFIRLPVSPQTRGAYVN